MSGAATQPLGVRYRIGVVVLVDQKFPYFTRLVARP